MPLKNGDIIQGISGTRYTVTAITDDKVRVRRHGDDVVIELHRGSVNWMLHRCDWEVIGHDH